MIAAPSAIAKIRHPHIVSVFDVGCDQGHHWFAMELIDGPSLADVLAALRDHGTYSSTAGPGPLPLEGGSPSALAATDPPNAVTAEVSDTLGGMTLLEARSPVTVLTVDDLVGAVPGLGLPEGTGNALLSKLRNAQARLEDGNLVAACNLLDAALNQESAQRGAN